jgi:hypothetical protein
LNGALKPPIENRILLVLGGVAKARHHSIVLESLDVVKKAARTHTGVEEDCGRKSNAMFAMPSES